MKQLLLFIWLLAALPLYGELHHVEVETSPGAISWEWWQETDEPFRELIMSWDAVRPDDGEYMMWVCLEEGEWIPYARWSSLNQRTYGTISSTGHSTSHRSIAMCTQDPQNRFGVRIEARWGTATLDQFERVHFYTSTYDCVREGPFFYRGRGLVMPDMTLPDDVSSFELPVAGFSQMTLNHPRSSWCCLPCAASALTRYLTGEELDAVQFCGKVWDRGFDVFYSFVLNLAEVSERLGPEWECWIQRTDYFAELYDYLRRGIPVIIGVKGCLPGAALVYVSGHFLVLTGYDAETGRILCVDPAFGSDETTHASYRPKDLAKAWARFGRMTLIFSPVE
jgi:hypothetical protein